MGQHLTDYQLGIHALHTALVILIEIGELVIEKDRGLQVGWDVEFYHILALHGHNCNRGVVRVVQKGILGIANGGILVRRAEKVE